MIINSYLYNTFITQQIMEITKELLKQKFKEYNKLYFNNELLMCSLRIPTCVMCLADT